MKKLHLGFRILFYPESRACKAGSNDSDYIPAVHPSTLPSSSGRRIVPTLPTKTRRKRTKAEESSSYVDPKIGNGRSTQNWSSDDLAVPPSSAAAMKSHRQIVIRADATGYDYEYLTVVFWHYFRPFKIYKFPILQNTKICARILNWSIFGPVVDASVTWTEVEDAYIMNHNQVRSRKLKNYILLIYSC
jgi:hypothetical protein